MPQKIERDSNQTLRATLALCGEIKATIGQFLALVFQQSQFGRRRNGVIHNICELFFYLLYIRLNFVTYDDLTVLITRKEADVTKTA